MKQATSSVTKQRVIEMYQAGSKLADITKATKVPRATIYYLLKQEGIMPDRVGRADQDAVPASELLDRLLECERQVGALRDQLERERAVTRYLLSNLGVDEASVRRAATKASSKGPVRPSRAS
jgi:hypothetical protein